MRSLIQVLFLHTASVKLNIQSDNMIV